MLWAECKDFRCHCDLVIDITHTAVSTHQAAVSTHQAAVSTHRLLSQHTRLLSPVVAKFT